MGKPVKGRHAIEVAVFSATLQNQFSKKSIEALMTLKESLKEKFPIFTPITKFEFRLENQLLEKGVQATSGVNLLQNDQQGKVLWALNVQDSSINISCFDYQRWTEISSEALETLLFVIQVIADDQNPVSTLALQYVDRFVGQADNYKLNQVFNTKTKFISKQTGQSGLLWHLFQGWFQTVEGCDAKHLNVLNLSTNDTQLGIVTTIDHTSRIVFTSSIPVTKITKEFVSPIYKLLHECNKDILIDLLNARQRKAIKLC